MERYKGISLSLPKSYIFVSAVSRPFRLALQVCNYLLGFAYIHLLFSVYFSS